MSLGNWRISSPIGVGLVILGMLSLVSLGNHHAQPRAAEAYSQQDQQQTQVVTQADAAQLKAERDEARAERDLKAQEEMARWSFWLLIVTAAGIVLLAATLRETYKAGQSAAYILGETKRQADIAERTASQQARPWLTLNAELAGDLIIEQGYQNRGLRVDARVTIRNVGNGPAKNIWIHAVANNLCELDISVFANDYFKSCIQRATDQHSYGTLLAPTEPHEEIHGTMVLEADLARVLMPGGEPFVAPFLIILVTYRGLEGDKIYFTGKTYHVVQAGPTGSRAVALNSLPIACADAGLSYSPQEARVG